MSAAFFSFNPITVIVGGVIVALGVAFFVARRAIHGQPVRALVPLSGGLGREGDEAVPELVDVYVEDLKKVKDEVTRWEDVMPLSVKVFHSEEGEEGKTHSTTTPTPLPYLHSTTTPGPRRFFRTRKPHVAAPVEAGVDEDTNAPHDADENIEALEVTMTIIMPMQSLHLRDDEVEYALGVVRTPWYGGLDLDPC